MLETIEERLVSLIDSGVIVVGILEDLEEQSTGPTLQYDETVWPNVSQHELCPVTYNEIRTMKSLPKE